MSTNTQRRYTSLSTKPPPSTKPAKYRVLPTPLVRLRTRLQMHCAVSVSLSYLPQSFVTLRHRDQFSKQNPCRDSIWDDILQELCTISRRFKDMIIMVNFNAHTVYVSPPNATPDVFYFHSSVDICSDAYSNKFLTLYQHLNLQIANGVQESGVAKSLGGTGNEIAPPPMSIILYPATYVRHGLHDLSISAQKREDIELSNTATYFTAPLLLSKRSLLDSSGQHPISAWNTPGCRGGVCGEVR